MKARHYLAALGSVLLLAAAPGSDEARRDALRVDGALRDMFHEGRIGPTVTMDTLLPAPELYAVGALEQLSGELTVIGGKVYLSYPDGDEARTELSTGEETAATLLVSALVTRWHTVPVESPISFAELDEAIVKLATSAGFSSEDRFPFLVEGSVEQLRWHVIDGSRLEAGGSSHADHLAAAVTGSEERVAATLVGFYSPRDQGVFTHRGSRTHVHCLIEEPLLTGHVDHVVVPAGAVVRFPVVARE